MNRERLEILVLARDATTSKRLEVEAVAHALYRYADTAMSEAAWRDEVGETRDRLAHRDARDELRRRTGVRKAMTWRQLTERVLPAIALGLEPVDATLGDRDAWTAAIAARILGLWRAGKPPSLASVCDAVAWRQFGLAGRAKRCPPEIRAYVLQQILHSDPGAPERQLRLYVARELGIGTELRAMRDGLVRRWLLDRSLVQDFATDVLRLARSVTHGSFGERKVFISALWDVLRRERSWAELSLAEFKTRILASQRAGELVLARADLVAAMDPQLVAASETVDGGASFHFIVREGAP